MQACSLNPPLARVYPPTVMEWKCNRKCVNMALEARYPDGNYSHQKLDLKMIECSSSRSVN